MIFFIKTYRDWSKAVITKNELGSHPAKNQAFDQKISTAPPSTGQDPILTVNALAGCAAAHRQRPETCENRAPFPVTASK